MLDKLEPIIRAKAIQDLKKLAKFDDIEAAHNAADTVLCNLLVGLGYSDVVEAWHKVPKWYA